MLLAEYLADITIDVSICAMIMVAIHVPVIAHRIGTESKYNPNRLSDINKAASQQSQLKAPFPDTDRYG